MLTARNNERNPPTWEKDPTKFAEAQMKEMMALGFYHFPAKFGLFGMGDPTAPWPTEQEILDHAKGTLVKASAIVRWAVGALYCTRSSSLDASFRARHSLRVSPPRVAHPRAPARLSSPKKNYAGDGVDL